MRLIYSLSFVLFFVTAVIAQGPVNDDCASAIDLGTLPSCSGIVFSNIGATASSLGRNDLPSCFNGGTTQRDVWFTFTTASQVGNVSITVAGTANGPNARSVINPQFAVYYGDCEGGLEEITDFCAKAPNGQTEIQADFAGLEPATTYFLRVNDYSATAAANAGDFTVCIEESVTPVNMGQASGSNACRGTLYDSGGPNGPYRNFELSTFTICPQVPDGCLEIELVEFAIEEFIPEGTPTLNGDQLLFFAGEGTGGPLLARISGFRAANEPPLKIQTSASCVTVVFSSDILVNFAGFALNWRCLPECTASSADNPTTISSLPFTGSFSTCEGAATVGETPCSNDPFMGGPDFIFLYESPGNICLDISVSNAVGGTGVAILNGPPGVDETLCIASSSRGAIPQANLQEPGLYYIVVSNANSCSNFNISVDVAECSISPSLRDALCNPLNGCINDQGIPSVFFFEDGFQDMPISDLNRGCWEGFGDEPDFVWFTIQARADGPFGFILQSGDNISDIDFNVWGPFTPDQVCGDPESIIGFIQTNQPIRSSYAPSEAGITGMTARHPQFGFPIIDEYDCGNIVGSGGDDFVRPIDAKTGEVYIVLMNDWGNEIEEGGILIDWSPSDPKVIGPIIPEVVSNVDTALCLGDSIQIVLESGINAIQWLTDTATLSCTDCLNPVAKPLQTTTYRALIDGVCYKDTIDVTINVLNIDLGPDIEVCFGAEFELNAGPDYVNARYEWIVPDGITLSCTDCSSPTVRAVQSGVFTLEANLISNNCTLSDQIIVSVGPEAQPAPQYTIRDDLSICLGDSVRIGGPAVSGVTYQWSSLPSGFVSEEADPLVRPLGTTTYFLDVSNGLCPLPVRDSIKVEVSPPPALKLVADTLACQGDTLVLGLGEAESEVTYRWVTPSGTIQNASPHSPLVMGVPGSQIYTLEAQRNGCSVSASVTVNTTAISVEIAGQDTVLLCKGDEQLLVVNVTPANAVVEWIPADKVESLGGNRYATSPTRGGVFSVKATNAECARYDTVYIAVDSLPVDMKIMPMDTTICEGETVILKSKIYQPRDFPNIKFKWIPSDGQQTPDSLYNLVVTPSDTTIYERIVTNGVCVDTIRATVNVNKIQEISIVPGDTTICQGEFVDLRIEIPPGKKMEEIMWTPEAGLSCTDCEKPRARPSSRIVYNVEGKIDNCPVNASAAIEVLPAPTVSLISNTSICIGQSIQLNTRADASTTYEWTSPNDPNFSSKQGLLIVSPTQTTTYRLTARRGDCAEFKGEVTITVVPQVTLSFNAPSQICQGDPLSLSAQVTPNPGVGSNYIWLFNGQQITGANPTINGLRTTTTFTLIYENPCQTLQRTFTVEVKEAVRISGILVEPTEFLTEGVPLGQSITLTAETLGDIGGATIQWTANGQPISGNGRTITHEPTEENTVYTVTITTPSGCVSTANVEVTVVIPRFEVPNAFTPNGDGVNDFFNVIATPGAVFEVTLFRVWNRWGQLVYDNGNPDEGWDGSHKGNPAPSDTYIYKITVLLPNGDQRNFEGDVTLIR